MSHNYLKLLTLCPYELIKMLNMFISIKFKHGVYQQCIRLHVNPLLRRLCFYWCLSFRLPAALIKKLFTDFNEILHIFILLFFVYIHIFCIVLLVFFHHWFDPVKVLKRPALKN